MQKQKKVPLRMCLGCQEMKPKKELIRVVKNQAGEISLDFKGKKPGRGAYICNSTVCFQKARKGKKFERAFSQAIAEEVYRQIEEELGKQDE
ncbi:MAG: RNase P modulator RnpM [Clostridia bacterium]